jgi:hypothetical protein
LPADDPGDIVPAGPALGAGARAAPRTGTPRAPTTAPELPLAPIEPVLPPPPPPAAKGAARTPAAQAAEIRGRAAGLLARLLQARGARQLDLKPATPPAEFDGPDSELFRLQDEILYQALETLRRPPAEAPVPK